MTVWHSSDPHSLHRHIIFRFFHRPITSRFRAAFGARIISFPCADPRTRGAAERREAHTGVFDHAGEARCRVGNTQPSRCDRDDASRRSTIAMIQLK